MEQVEIKKITYKELTSYEVCEREDPYMLMREYLTSNVCKALLSNPNLVDYNATALNILVRDGEIVGRHMLMPTRVKIRAHILACQTGGSYEVCNQFRGYGFGTLLARESLINIKDNVLYIGQLYSTTAIEVVRKLGLFIFELPLYYKLCHSRPVWEAKGLKGISLQACSAFADVLIKALDIPKRMKQRKLREKFLIKKESIIPEWVDDIILNDVHPYAEIHDRNWFQWCLDNKFTDEPQDCQSFYAVYDLDDNPKGFFMVKKRYETNQAAYTNVIRGMIVEWGSFDENELNEIDLNLLAIQTLEKEVDNVVTVLSNGKFAKKMRKIGFIRHGNYQMAVNPGNLNVEGIEDKGNWRIRYGGCNTILC